MTDVDPLPRLADSVAAIGAQLHSISAELRTLEAARAGGQTAPPQVPSPPYGDPYAQPYAYPPPAHRYPQPFRRDPAIVRAPADPGPTLWERLSREGAGSRLIAWTGGATTLVGVVLLLVLAVQRGYLGPAPRVLLGVLLAVALLGIALRVHRIADAASGAHAIAATGLAIGYLDTIAATAYYHFVPAPAGLLIGLVVAGVGVAIALHWDSQLLATFVTLACAGSAVALAHDVTLLVGFLLVLQVASAPAMLSRRWSALAAASALPAVLAVLADAVTTAVDRHHDAVTVAVLCLAVALVQTAVATLHAVTDRERASVAARLLVLAPVPALVAALSVSRPQAVALSAGLACALIGLCATARVLLLPRVFADAAAWVGLAASFEALCIGFAGDARTVAVLLAATLLAGLSARLRHLPSLAAAALFAAAGAALALADGLRVDYVAVAPTGSVGRGTIVAAATTGLALAAAALTVAWASGRAAAADKPAAVHTRWTVGGAVALYGATGTVVSIGLAISPDEHGFLVGHMLVTLSWTVGALVLLLRHVDSVPLRVAGLALVGAALAKLVLFDLASLSGIPRVLTFLGGGLVLLAAGARYAKSVTASGT